MRRILSLALTALMIISMFTIGAFTTTVSAADADGSVEAGYTPAGTAINSAAEFAAITEDGEYYLAADITVDSTLDVNFGGVLDGNGKTITVSAPLFAYMTGATVKNLKIEGAIDFSAEDWHCGAVAQEARDVTLDNVANLATVKGYYTGQKVVEPDPLTGEEKTVYNTIYTGGLLGSAYGDITIKNCSNGAEITGLGAAGLVGSVKLVPKGEDNTDVETTVVFENCLNYGRISDDDCEQYITIGTGSCNGCNGSNKAAHTFDEIKVTGNGGGIVAYCAASVVDFTNCNNTADISFTCGEVNVYSNYGNHCGGPRAGGIAGYVLEASTLKPCQVTFTNCQNDGDVIGYDQCGGIGGWIRCSVSSYNCTNNGTIRSRNNYCAGILGRSGVDYSSTTIYLLYKYCVNNGDVIANRQYAGGITSYTRNDMEIWYCVNNGNLSGEGISAEKNDTNCSIACGGIFVRAGEAAQIFNCVNTGNMISNSYSGGIVGYTGGSGVVGYNLVLNCINTGDVLCYSKNNQALSDTRYFSGYGSGGIMAYTYGSGSTQFPTVQGCGVTGKVFADEDIVGGFIGYFNTPAAVISYNYFLGELESPGNVRQVEHNGVGGTDFCMEYLICWNNKSTSDAFEYNYCYESIVNNGTKLVQQAGVEYDFAGYEWFITPAQVASGELAYLLNDAWGEDIFFQKIGTDLVPMNDIDLDGDGKIWAVVENAGAFSNEEVEAPSMTTEEEETTEKPETTEKEEETTEEIVETTEEVVDTQGQTQAPETDPETQAPVTDPAPVEPSGCGSVIGASVALVALALLAPAGVMLKKKED